MINSSVCFSFASIILHGLLFHTLNLQSLVRYMFCVSEFCFLTFLFCYLELSPSICSGVVAKVVHAKKKLFTESSFQDATELPAMLETTAAVHPGGSGGAVVNSSGHMIGLVTR